MVKISVIVPMFNVKPYLKQALDSLVNQTLNEIEIIVVNDGSTDGSRDIAIEYAQKDSRVKLVDQPNGGYGKAMNNGIAHATGEYIGILEPDDYVELNMFEELYNKAIENQANIIRSQSIGFWDDQQGHIYKTVLHTNNEQNLKSKNEGWLYLRQDPYMLFWPASIWTAIYKRSFLTEHDIKLQETPGASYQDFPFFIETFFTAQKMFAVTKHYYHYRQSNPNSSIKANDKAMVFASYWDYVSAKLSASNPNEWQRMKNAIALAFWQQRNFLWTIMKPSLRRPYVKSLYSRFKKEGLNIDSPTYRVVQKYGVNGLLIGQMIRLGNPDIYNFILFLKKEVVDVILIPLKMFLFLTKIGLVLMGKLMAGR